MKEKPEIKTEIHASIPDHQVLLAFNNDSDAVYFIEWWEAFGEDAFMAWATKQGA